MAILEPVERELLQSVDINPASVGKVISTGSQNRVRFLAGPTSDRENVVKARIKDVCTWARNPLLRSINYFTCQSADQAKSEYEQCVEYFDGYVLPTDIRIAPDQERFVMVQPTIDIQKLSLPLINEYGDIRRQLEDILDRNGVMIKETEHWLDVAGMNIPKTLLLYFFGTPFSDNIVVDKKTGNLSIIDTGVYKNNQAFGTAVKIQRKNAQRFGLHFEGTQKEHGTVSSQHPLVLPDSLPSVQ